uniref:RNA polymerase, sigma-24 subunit, ECF subfamily n=1 Tax=Solibacter usitatus (strain Ellin6076) TaxID=234267 RepID=Q01TL1_SOLUE
MQTDAVQSGLGALVPREHPAEQLMALYQQADASAAAALVDLLSPQVFHFFASQMGSTKEAEDMLQEVWLRIHRVRHTYRPGEPVLPWVYAIAHRVRIDNYRKRSRISSREVEPTCCPKGGMNAWLAAGLDQAHLPQLSVRELHAAVAEGATVLDVRSPGEWRTGHIASAIHIPSGDLSECLQELPVCSSPTRSNSPSWRTRSNFDCNSSGISPTSSKNNVPPSANWKRPARSRIAPVPASRAPVCTPACRGLPSDSS